MEMESVTKGIYDADNNSGDKRCHVYITKLEKNVAKLKSSLLKV